MVKGNIVVSLAALALAGAFYAMGSRFAPIVDGAPGPGFMPKALAAALAVLAAALFAQTLWRRRRGGDAVDAHPFASPAMPLVYTLIGLCVGYALLVVFAGFMIGTLVFMAVCMRAMGERSRRWLVGVPVAVCALFFVIFAFFFNMPLPAGMLFE